MPFYQMLVEATFDRYRCFASYGAWGGHVGEAIGKAVKAAQLEGGKDVIVPEAIPDSLSRLSWSGRKRRLVGGAGVYIFGSRSCYTPDEVFLPPEGLIGSYGEEGAHDHLDVAPGFESYSEDGVHSVFVVVDRRQLEPVYARLVASFPRLKVMWLRLSSEWDDVGEEAFFANEAIDTPEAALAFLRANRSDTIRNGLVSVTAYAEEGHTNINLDAHKTLYVHTTNTAVQNRACDLLRDFGLRETSPLLSLEIEYHHWHYRPADSLCRSDFEGMLTRSGFKPWTPGR